MNGFKQEMIQRFLAVTPHIELAPITASVAPNSIDALAEFRFYPVEAAAMKNGHFLPLRLAATKNFKGTKTLIVPSVLAAKMQLTNNTKIQIITPNLSPFFAIPKVKKLIVQVKDLPSWQSDYCYISYELGQLLSLLNEASLPKINLMLAEPIYALEYAKKLSKQLPNWQITTWQELHQEFFQLIATQKSMMFLVLFFIIIIAGFGLISGQVMLVQERRSEIAILITLGFAPNGLLLSYFLRGFWMGFIGLLLGVLLGIFVAYNVTILVNFIEYLSGQAWLSHALYGMDHMPSKILPSDLWRLLSYGMILCGLTPIYPAYLASRAEPITVLRQQGAG